VKQDFPKGIRAENYGLHQAYWGERHFDRLFQQLAEESGELLQSMAHLKRGRVKPQDVVAELGDVLLCMSFAAYSVGSSWTDVLAAARRKQTRMANAIRREIAKAIARSGPRRCPECSSPICEAVVVHGKSMNYVGHRCHFCGDVFDLEAEV